VLAAVTAIAPRFRFDTAKRGVTSSTRFEFPWDAEAFSLPIGGQPSFIKPGHEAKLLNHLAEMLTGTPPAGCRVLVDLYRLQWSARAETEGSVIVAVRLVAPDEIEPADVPQLVVEQLGG